MKKIIVYILCLAVTVVSMSACSKKELSNEQEENDTVIENQVEDNTNENISQNNEQTQENKEENKAENRGEKEEQSKPSSDNTKPAVNEEKPAESGISLSKLASSMISVIPEEQHNLELIPEELYKDIYGIDKSQFADCIIYGTMISVKANEIILIKVNDEKDINKAKEILTNRKNQVYKTWEQYLPDQFEMVKSGVINAQGRYAALIITPEVNNVSSKFIELTK